MKVVVEEGVAAAAVVEGQKNVEGVVVEKGEFVAVAKIAAVA